MYRMKHNIYIIMLIGILVMIGCSKNIQNKSGKQIHIGKILEMNSDELRKSKGRGSQTLDKNGNLISVTYRENIFGQNKVNTTYYFFEDRDRISGLKLEFPKNANGKDIVKGVTESIGAPKIEEFDEKYKEHYVEWEYKNAYFTLDNFKKLEDGDLIELTVVVVE